MSLLILFAGSDGGTPGPALAFVLDLNTRLWVFLIETLYPLLDDLTTMLTIDLSTIQVNDEWTARFHALIAEATAAMS